MVHGASLGWNEKVGVIRGFNELGKPYPGFSEADVMRKAKSLGYNSVRTGDFFRLWLKSTDDAKRRLHQLLDEAGANGLTVLPVMLWGTPSIPGGRATLQEPEAQPPVKLPDRVIPELPDTAMLIFCVQVERV